MEELLVSLTHKRAAGFNSEYQSFSMSGFLFIYLFLFVKLSPAFHLCSAFFATHQAPRFIHQTPCLDFMGTAIVPNIFTGVVIGRNGGSSLERCA